MIPAPISALGNSKNLSLDSFIFLKCIGRGAFAKVLLAEHKDTNTIVVIKALKKFKVVQDNDVDAVLAERR